MGSRHGGALRDRRALAEIPEFGIRERSVQKKLIDEYAFSQINST
jgi:hypothetical protein